MYSAPSLSSLSKVTIETVPMFVWLNTDRSRPRGWNIGRFLSPLLFPSGDQCCAAVEVPLSVVGVQRSSFQVAWQPSFPVLLGVILWASSWRHIVQGVPSAVWIARCCTHIPDRLPWPEFVPFSGILRRHCMWIWLRFPQVIFSCSVPSLVWGKYVSPLKVLSKLPGHDPFHQLSHVVLHCEYTVSVQLAMVLSRFGDWLEVAIWPVFWNLSCCEAFFVQFEELSLVSMDRFLMSEYLTLSGPEALSLLSPESVSVNSSSVIRSSFEPASVRILSSPFHIAFLSSTLFWLLCWTKRWSSAEPFSLLVFSIAPPSIHEAGGNGFRSAALHLSVELPELSECCVSDESVTDSFPLPVFCFTGHFLEHLSFLPCAL